MVQTFFRRVLPHSGNYRAVLHLGAPTHEIARRWPPDFSSTRDRDHGKLLLFQSAHDRAVLIADRRFCSRLAASRRYAASEGEHGDTAPWLHWPVRPARGRLGEGGWSRPPATIVRLHWHNCHHRDVADQ